VLHYKIQTAPVRNIPEEKFIFAVIVAEFAVNLQFLQRKILAMYRLTANIVIIFGLI